MAQAHPGTNEHLVARHSNHSQPAPGTSSTDVTNDSSSYSNAHSSTDATNWGPPSSPPLKGTSWSDQPSSISSPMPIRTSQLPRNALLPVGGSGAPGGAQRGEGGGEGGGGGVGGGEGVHTISFSSLPMGRSFSESQHARRTHEYSASPARSLVQVLESAEAAEAAGTTVDHDVASNDHWVAHASEGTGVSAVHFQPQRGHPGHRGRPGSGVGSSGWMGTSVPESRFSEFEVVYDDGVRKQRTFSLTTQMDEEDDQISSSEDDNSESSPLLEYQEAVPSSDHFQSLQTHGAHRHGGYTGHLAGGRGASPSGAQAHSADFLGKQNLHPSSAVSNGQHSFLPFESNNPFGRFVSGAQAAWHRATHFTLSTPNRRILKASLAYLLACLVSFTPFFLPYIGASGHLAASSAVFFNPAKSLGRMVDAVTAGLCAIGFGVLVSTGSMASAVWFNNRDLYIWGHVVSVVIFGGGSTFIIAYAKAHYNRPTVNVACTLSHIMILVTLTKEGAMSLVEFNLTRVLAITASMLLGVIISTIISIFLWPESAHEKLRQDMGKSLSSFRLLLKLLTKTFLLEANTTPFGSESVQKLIESQVKSFSALAKSLEEAQLEFPGSDIQKYEDCVKSLNTLAQYLNGLRSSCGLQYDMLKKDEQRKDVQVQRRSVSATTGGNAGTGTAITGAGLTGRRSLGMGVRMSSYSLIGSMNSDQDQSASADLIQFLEHVGKPMKSLALTCKLTIEHLQDIFTSTDGDRLPSTRGDARPKFSHSRRSGYDSAEVASDSTFDIGTSRTHPGFSSDTSKKNPSLDHMQVNLAKALDIFETANSKALKQFYSHQQKRRSETLKRPFGMTNRMSGPSLQDLASEISEAAAGLGTDPERDAPDGTLMEKAPVGEQIFLVYFFVFNLMEFSKELSHLVSCVEILVDGDEGLPLWIARNRQSWWRRIWFSITGFPRRFRRQPFDRKVKDYSEDPEAGLDSSFEDPAHHARGSATHSSSKHDQNTSYGTSTGFRRRRKQRLFPKPNMHNTTNTLQTPTPSTFSQQWSTRLWKFLHIFRSFQVKYAVKAAVSTIILLIPAFVDWTRPYFVQYRGEWALISMLIVMVPTVGGTNIVGIYRIMGTIAGCYIGVAVYLLFPAHQIMLPICCFLFAVPNFYLVLCSNYPRIGQVTLLAFNLVLIQTYNRRNGDGTVPPDDEDEDEDLSRFFPPSTTVREFGSFIGDNPNDPSHVSAVWTIAIHRAVAVSVGVVIGVLVTSYVWPYEARVELRKGLSDLLLNISWLYNRLVSVYSTNLDRVSVIPPEEPHQKGRSKFRELMRRSTFQERFQTPAPDPHPPTGNSSSEMDIEKMNKEFMAIELSLQLQLLRLYALLEETPNEPRLKGKFPVGTYKNMLGSCQNILDRFLSMRLVITKDEWLESARRDFIVPVNKERREMVGNVLLYFYTIASAMRLKTPLPPYLPPANNARLRLIQKIRQLPVVQNKVVMTETNDERYIFYYAYALVMEDVIRELERLGRWSQDLFGVITPASEFEAWFTDDGITPLALPTPHMPSSATREAPLSPYHDVDQPYQYPTLQQSDTRTISAGDQGRLSPQGASVSGIYRSQTEEASEIPYSETQSTSNYHSMQNSINERDGMFDFDLQDPFRDQTNISEDGKIDGDNGGRPLSSVQGMGASLRTGRRFNSSNSLHSAGSESHGQQRQKSHGSGSGSNVPRSQSLQSNRTYGTMPQSSGLGSTGGRLKKTGTDSSRSSSRGGTFSGGVGLVLPNTSRTNTMERPE